MYPYVLCTEFDITLITKPCLDLPATILFAAYNYTCSVTLLQHMPTIPTILPYTIRGRKWGIYVYMYSRPDYPVQDEPLHCCLLNTIGNLIMTVYLPVIAQLFSTMSTVMIGNSSLQYVLNKCYNNGKEWTHACTNLS